MPPGGDFNPSALSERRCRNSHRLSATALAVQPIRAATAASVAVPSRAISSAVQAFDFGFSNPSLVRLTLLVANRDGLR